MSASRWMALASIALIALLLMGISPMQSDYVDLGKTRLAVVRIPAGTFQMGTDKVVMAMRNGNPARSALPGMMWNALCTK